MPTQETTTRKEIITEGTESFEVEYTETRRTKITGQSRAANVIFQFLKRGVVVDETLLPDELIRDASVAIAERLKALKLLK